MAEQTNKDALIAEMLGDIGLLHDSVESLKLVLPEQIKTIRETTDRFDNSIQKIQANFKDTKQQLDLFVEEAQKNLIDKARAEVMQAIDEAMKSPLTQLKNEVSASTDKINTTTSQAYIKLIIAGLLSVLIGALAGYKISSAAINSHAALENTDMKNGRALSIVWGQLSQKEQEHIEALTRSIKQPSQ
jgi:hypothetical protein